MADDDDHAAFTPFKPVSGPVDQRIAAALEYIATQLGELNAKIGDHDEDEYENDDDEKDDEKEEAPPRRR
jgi:hypothetical protein